MSNQSSHVLPTRTVERSSCKISKLGKYRNEDSYGKVRGSVGEERHGICEILWRETLGRNLGSYAAEHVGGMCHDSGCRQKTTRLHAISCTTTRWSSIIHNRVLHQALARSLRESKVQFVVEDTWLFRERDSGQNSRLCTRYVWTS